MRINARLDVSGLELNRLQPQLNRRFQSFRKPTHQAMADQFRQCTHDNLGSAGVFRPHQWKALSPSYARKVGRTYATLFVSGILKAAIKARANEDHGSVSVSKADCEYSLAHQFGVPERNLPDRPYFPIRKDGEIVRAVVDLVIKSAQLAIRRLAK